MLGIDLKTAFYDAMFARTDAGINPIEEQAIVNVRKLLNDHAELSSHIRPMPMLQIQLLQLLEKSDVEIEELVELIEQDPALATKVLSIVNSPMYLTNVPAKNLAAAVMRLGISGISGIASSVMMEKVRPPKPIYYKMFGKQIWVHCLHCAFLCKGFARESGEDEFTGHFLGLIHDVGKIIIFNCLNDALSAGVIEGEPGSRGFKELMSEMSLDISYFIAREWKLPEKFCTALQEQVGEVEAPLSIALQKANLCAEVYLLFKNERIDEEEMKEFIQGQGYDGEVWEEFLDKAEDIAASI